MADFPITFKSFGWSPRHTGVYERVFTDRHGLHVVDGGGMSLTCGERHFALEGAWCWSTTVGPRYVYGPLASPGYWGHRYLAFWGPRAEEWIAHDLYPFDPQPISPDLAIGACIARITGLLLYERPREQYQAINQLEEVLLTLAQERAVQSSRQPAWLEYVIARLHADLAAPVDYTGLAAECHIALITLRQQFRRMMGVPIHTYRTRLRLHAARNLLSETDAAIASIAEQLGFTDAAYFTRQFHQLQGMTPGQLRRQAQK
ncbi:MAG TPA: AraC family transcriptional regulator [Armatimonadota bacterium]|jgi:AraC-like DNA-binding protein